MIRRTRPAALILPALLMIIIASPRRSEAYDPPIDLDGAQVIETYSNGAKKYTLADGSEAVIFENGYARVERADGTVVQTWPPNGKYNELQRVTRPDGTVESYYADGGHKVTLKNGHIRTTWPNGRIREIHPDGTVWTTSTAKRTVVNPDVVIMSPWPRQVDEGAQVIFKGKLMPGYSDLWASILLADGTIRHVPAENIRSDGKRFYLEVNFDAGPGRYKVEIIASGKYGNEVAVNVSVWAGMDPPEATAPKLYPLADQKTPLDVLEKRFWRMVNDKRAEHNIRELPWDMEVSQVARSHAREMAAGGFFGHISPKHGSLAQRAVNLFDWQKTIWGLPSTGVTGGKRNYLAENLSRTHSLGDALDSLMDSPAHRALIINPYFTACGTGMSWGNYGDNKMLFIVTAMLQKNRPTKGPPPKTKPKREKGPSGFHIFGRPGEEEE